MIPAPQLMELTPFLPLTWQQELEQAATRARRVTTDGPGPGSLATGHRAGLDYRTLQGVAEIGLPWLTHLHRVTIPVLLELQHCHGVQPIDGPHGVSLNVLAAGQGLEWHVDGGDVVRTVVLATRTWDSDFGGQLLTHNGNTVEHHVMLPGRAWSIGTGVTPHSVQQLDPEVDTDRVTVMFAYTGPEATARDAEQDTYIGVERSA